METFLGSRYGITARIWWRDVDRENLVAASTKVHHARGFGGGGTWLIWGMSNVGDLFSNAMS
jgi:hypothetical protein